MHARLSCAVFLLAAASVAQQSSHATSSMSDREKEGLRGSVKEISDSQTLSLPNGEQVLTTTTRYSLDGRILEVRTVNPDGSAWLTTYTYYPDGRLLPLQPSTGFLQCSLFSIREKTGTAALDVTSLS